MAAILMKRLRDCFLVILAVATPGCAQFDRAQQTFDLREVQRQFSDAVRADNTATTDPFVAGQSEALYHDVARALDDDQIAALEPRLQPNAWMMRAVSAWRTGEYTAAIAAAARGAESPAVIQQSRDQILLALIPALVIDAELRTRLAHEAGTLDPAQYNAADGYRVNFETALGELAGARALVGPATPASVIHYVDYQKWRLLTNWRYVLNQLATREARKAAHAAAAAFLGSDIQDAIAAAETAIPDGEPLRQLILVQGTAR